jgi:hypothetical protein
VIRFSQPTTVTQSSLVIKGFNQANYATNGFSYDSSTDTATWNLTTPITNDRVLLDLNTPQGNFDLGSLTEDGELLRFSVLAADANRDGKTNIQDVIAINNRLGQTTANPSYSIFHDVNGSGVINASDRAEAIANNFARLPVGQPSLPVGPSPAAADAVVVSAAKSGGAGIAALAVVRSRDAAAVESRIVARVRSDVRASSVDSALGELSTPRDGTASTSEIRARRLSRAAIHPSAFDEVLGSF